MKLHSKFPPIVQALFWAVTAWVLGSYFSFYELPISFPVFAIAGIAGIAFLVAAIVDFQRHRTTVNPLDPQKASALVTDGPYRIARNPMYLGMALLLLAWCLYLAELVALTVVPLFVVTVTALQIKAEEDALVAQFGDQYRQYMGRVGRWLIL